MATSTSRVDSTARFHWRLPEAGETDGAVVTRDRDARDRGRPDLQAQASFCLRAEAAGIDSVLVNLQFSVPDPMTLSLALATRTERMRFMVAVRPGLMSPTLLVQQVNTFSALTGGRICLNMVAGHSPDEMHYYGDSQPHDQRYERMEEFLTVCRAFWQSKDPVDFKGRHYVIEQGRLNTRFVSDRDPSTSSGSSRATSRDETQPEIYLGGASAGAREVAARHATVWMRFPDRPDTLRQDIQPVLSRGAAAGLRMSIICRPSRDEALEVIRTLMSSPQIEAKRRSEASFVKKSDSQSVRSVFEMAQEEWLTPSLWAGGAGVLGAPSIALVGSPDEVAAGILEFKEAGISHFIFSGWPKVDEMVRFGESVLPLVRKLEAAAAGRHTVTPDDRKAVSRAD